MGYHQFTGKCDGMCDSCDCHLHPAKAKEIREAQRAPVGYRLDYKPGDPCYSSPEDYEKARRAGYDGADVWGLFPEPQPGCPSDVEVYHGWCWVQPRYVSAVRDMTGFTPLYRGPLLQRAPIDEDVLHVFPSQVEDRLREERPDLYPPGV